MLKLGAIVIVSFLLGSTGSAFGQKSLTVRKGDTFSYALSMKMDMMQSMQGQEMTTTIAADGSSRLQASRVARRAVDWVYDIREVKTHAAVAGMGVQDTTISLPPAPFSTDLKGKITAQPQIGDILPGVGGMSALTGVEQYFSPALTRALSVGDTWESTTIDTVHNGGLEIHTTRRLQYTCEGDVDTLGKRVVRIRSEASELTMEGSGNVSGMNMSMEGDGTAITLSYYSRTDGLLVASSVDSEVNARLSIEGMGANPMLIPMNYRTRMSVVRR